MTQKFTTRAEVDAHFAKVAPLFAKLEAQTQEERDRWQAELDMLKRRTETAYDTIDLGGGNMLAIRTGLTAPQLEELQELVKMQATLDPNDLEALDEVTYMTLHMVAANPLLTRDWFREHKADYAVLDAVEMITGFYERRVERQRERFRRIAALTSFRPEPAGAEARELPALHGVPGSP
jgi:hypothetical protein